MNKSESITNLAKALHAAQASIKAAIKSADNPFFRSKYADLVAVWEAARGPMQVNGLAVSQIPTCTPNGEAALETVLMHTSGEWLSGIYPLSPVKKDPQGQGAALSYAKRYGLCAVLGIVTEAEDDDGETAQNRVKVSTKGDPKTKRPVYTDDQKREAGELRALFMPLKNGDAQFNALYKKMAFDEPSDFIDAARNLLRQLQDIAAQAEGP